MPTLRDKKKSQINNLNFTIQGTRKRTKTKVSRRKETIEIMAKNKWNIEMKKTMEKINGSTNRFFEKINKTGKTFS